MSVVRESVCERGGFCVCVSGWWLRGACGGACADGSRRCRPAGSKAGLAHTHFPGSVACRSRRLPHTRSGDPSDWDRRTWALRRRASFALESPPTNNRLSACDSQPEPEGSSSPHQLTAFATTMAEKKVEQYYTPPPKLGRWEGFRIFLWNSETNQFLGRTGSSWGEYRHYFSLHLTYYSTTHTKHQPFTYFLQT